MMCGVKLLLWYEGHHLAYFIVLSETVAEFRGMNNTFGYKLVMFDAV